MRSFAIAIAAVTAVSVYSVPAKEIVAGIANMSLIKI